MRLQSRCGNPSVDGMYKIHDVDGCSGILSIVLSEAVEVASFKLRVGREACVLKLKVCNGTRMRTLKFN